MQFRPATADDVPAVLPMVSKIAALHMQWEPAKYGFTIDPAMRYSNWLASRANDPRSVFLVAQRDDEGGKPGALIAFLIGAVEQEIPIYTLREYGIIHDLWVEEAYRHEGVGRQLTMLAIERFAAMGVKQIRLDTAAANEPARALFRSCGFRPSSIEMLVEISGGAKP